VRRAGFTLLETLVALAVTAVILAALGEVVLRTATARTRATAAADRTGAGRTVLLRLAHEIEAAVPPVAPGTDAPERLVVDTPADRGASSTLRFVTLGPPATPGASDLHALTYAREVDPQQPGTAALVRRAGSSAAAQTMLTGIRRFRVRCFDGGAWHDEWEREPLPRAVEVEVDLDDGAGGVTPLTTTVTVAAAAH